MSWIRTPPDDAATGEAAAAYDRDRETLGYVANYTRVFANRPAVLEAWRALNGAIKASMDPRRYELATVAAALRLRSATARSRTASCSLSSSTGRQPSPPSSPPPRRRR